MWHPSQMWNGCHAVAASSSGHTDGYSLLRAKNSTRMDDTDSTTSGRRVVGWVFVTALTIGVGFGYFVGAVISNDAAVSIGILFVTFRPTPLNMATYGGVSVLILSGVFYGVMRLTARYDDEAKST